MPLLGAHMSIAGHPHRALSRGREAGCRVIQIFTRNRLKWAAKSLTRSEADSFFLNDPLFSNHPFLLETPKGRDEKGIDLDRVSLKRLEGIMSKERKNE
jgi:endonuclease IV